MIGTGHDKLGYSPLVARGRAMLANLPNCQRSRKRSVGILAWPVPPGAPDADFYDQLRRRSHKLCLLDREGANTASAELRSRAMACCSTS